MGYDKVPYPGRLQKEINDNAKSLKTLNASYSEEKAEVARLTSLKNNIDKFM